MGPPTTAAPVSLSAGSDVAPLIPPVLQLLQHCMPVHSMAQTQAQAEAATAMSAGRTGTGRFAGTDNFTGVSSLAGQQQQQCTTPQDVQQQQQQRQQRQRQQQEAVAAHIQSLLAGIRVQQQQQQQQQQQTSNLELLSSSVGVLDLLKRMEDKGQQQQHQQQQQQQQLFIGTSHASLSSPSEPLLHLPPAGAEMEGVERSGDVDGRALASAVDDAIGAVAQRISLSLLQQ